MSLFDNVPGRGPATPQSEQAGLAFPARLTEKYRPHTFADFVGLEKPKKIMQRFGGVSEV